MIQQFLDLSNYVTDARRNRRSGHNSTQEFFTPYNIIKIMADKIPVEYWSDPSKTFCEPSFGSGQFVLYIIWNRIQHGINWKTALETCYGVELMQDNVNETHDRIIKLLNIMNINFDKDIAYSIIRKNLVCADFFKWDFNNWHPIE